MSGSQFRACGTTTELSWRVRRPHAAATLSDQFARRSIASLDGGSRIYSATRKGWIYASTPDFGDPHQIFGTAIFVSSGLAALDDDARAMVVMTRFTHGS